MALIQCPECGRQISDKAPYCPGCGIPIAAAATEPVAAAPLTSRTWATAALADLQRAAEEGDAEAQFQLAARYSKGTGGAAIDEREAVRWLRQAAEQNHAEAQLELGVCLGHGKGVPVDRGEQERWYRRAAENGLPRAQAVMALILEYQPGGKTESLKWLIKAAEGGDARGCHYLAHKHREGDGIAKSEADYRRWMKLAIEYTQAEAVSGDSEAQHRLAQFYESPLNCYAGVIDRNYEEAIKWYLKASEQGLTASLSRAGWCYEIGLRNIQEAIRLYRRAADLGDDEGLRHLGWCYEDGKGVAKDVNEAVRLYRLAAANKNEWARNRLKHLE